MEQACHRQQEPHRARTALVSLRHPLYWRRVRKGTEFLGAWMRALVRLDLGRAADHSGADQFGQHCGVTRVLVCYELTPGKNPESTTISDRVLLTIVFSSACSLVGTANLSSVC